MFWGAAEGERRGHGSPVSVVALLRCSYGAKVSALENGPRGFLLRKFHLHAM